MIKTLLTILCFSFSFQGVAQKMPGQSITLSAMQQQFIIEVKAIPTTGYTWSVSNYDEKQFKFLGSEYETPAKDAADKPQLIGAPLKEYFKFKLLKPLLVKSTITLKLARAWEKEDGESHVFAIEPKKNINNIVADKK